MPPNRSVLRGVQQRIHRWLLAARAHPRFRIFAPTLDALDTFLARPGQVTSAAPHIRSHWDLKRYMIIVVLALIPCALTGIYLYGWRVAAVIAVSYAFGLGTEAAFAGIKNESMTEGAFVTCMLFPLTLPPTIPLWTVAVGIVFAIVFVKEIFGGTGRNLFNPALGGRCFIYLVFPQHLHGQVWPMPYTGGWGGFGHWMWNGAHRGFDALTAATAASAWKVAEVPVAEFTIRDMVLGVIPGSIGESPKILIVCAAILLIGVKVADWRLVVSPIIGALAMSALLHHTTGGWAPVPHLALVSGSLLFGATFMTTDPVSAPVMAPSKWIYGLAIGITAILIRVYSTTFPQGLMFAILLVNPFSPLLDYLFRTLRFRRHRA